MEKGKENITDGTMLRRTHSRHGDSVTGYLYSGWLSAKARKSQITRRKYRFRLSVSTLEILTFFNGRTRSCRLSAYYIRMYVDNYDSRLNTYNILT